MVGGVVTTGADMKNEVAGSIAEGDMGEVFNVKGVEKIRTLQEVPHREEPAPDSATRRDVIHGYETIVPIPLALSCSWNMEGIRESARIAAKEASAEGSTGRSVLMVDISLDAHFGRYSEGNGEDPFLGARIAEAMMQGYQGISAGMTISWHVSNSLRCMVP